jgi:hypothetical protein
VIPGLPASAGAATGTGGGGATSSVEHAAIESTSKAPARHEDTPRI